jgi:chromosome segregation ATPase
MRRLVSIFVFTWVAAGSLPAQNSLSDLELSARNAQQQWFRLASTLDARLTRMAPCDNAAPAAIEEANRASTARLAALIAFTKGVVEQAAQDLAMGRQIQRSQTDYAARLAAEQNSTEEERAGVQSQMTNLTESVRKRVSLTVANDELRKLEASIRERAALVVSEATASTGTLPRFTALVQALEKRESALRKQLTVLEDERTKWNGYYSARLARALVECTETGR